MLCSCVFVYFLNHCLFGPEAHFFLDSIGSPMLTFFCKPILTADQVERQAKPKVHFSHRMAHVRVAQIGPCRLQYPSDPATGFLFLSMITSCTKEKREIPPSSSYSSHLHEIWSPLAREYPCTFCLSSMHGHLIPRFSPTNSSYIPTLFQTPAAEPDYFSMRTSKPISLGCTQLACFPSASDILPKFLL